VDVAADKDIPRDIVTIRELAERWGKSEWTIGDWIRTGYLTVPVKRLKGVRYVRLRDADKWYDAQPEVATGIWKGKVKALMLQKLYKAEELPEEEPEEQSPPARVRVRLED
jgi:hypothetical protein